jgi:cobaltochelatase CobN
MKNKPVRIASIMWGSYLPTFLAAAEESPYVDLSIFSQKEIENNADCLELFWAAAAKADVVFFYWTTDGFWEEVSARIDEVAGARAIVTTSFDPANWGRCATVDLSVCARAYAYIAEGGRENYRRLLEFVAHQIDGEVPVHEPVPLPWQGILHPPDQTVYATVEDYRQEHPAAHDRTVGLLFSRHAFTNTDADLEQALIRALEERGLDVLPVFSHGTPDEESGALGPIETARRYFMDVDGRSRISALVNLHFFFLGREARGDVSETGVAAQTVEFFKSLNVPVFKPVISYSKSIAEWEEDPQGLTAEVSFGIAMPEFEGNIEPVIMACSRKLTDEGSGAVFEIREALSERITHICDRIARWIRLASKPPQARKVVFVFHKNECAGLEANVGGAAGLDSGQSVVEIMRRLQSQGYRIEDIPESWNARPSPSSAGPRWMKSLKRADTWPCWTTQFMNNGSTPCPAKQRRNWWPDGESRRGRP